MNKSTRRRALSGWDFNQLIFIAVPAFGYELRCFIQCCIWVGPQDGQFFCQAQLAVHSAAAVRLGIANDGPFYDRNVTLIFESPNKPRELSLVSLGQSFKVLLMVVITSFKIRLTTAMIRHRFAVWCTYGYL